VWWLARRLACSVWRQTVDPNTGIIFPSLAYRPQMWTRDAFWSGLATGDVALNVMALGLITRYQAPDAHVPTWIVLPWATQGRNSGGHNSREYSPMVRARAANEATSGVSARGSAAAPDLLTAYYARDESTLLYLVWAYVLATTRPGGLAAPSVPIRSLRNALAYVRLNMDAQGAYHSPGGPNTSWEDAFILPGPDVLAYTQGLAAVALEAARRLGLGVPEGEVHRAIVAYQRLARPWPARWIRGQLRGPIAGASGTGSNPTRAPELTADRPDTWISAPPRPAPGVPVYLPFSAHLPYRDPSVLTGDFLSTWLFGRHLLDRAVVQGTLASLCGSPFGYRTLCPEDGSYLPASDFSLPRQPGDGQNGGSWLLYDGLALGAGALQGVSGALPALQRRLGIELTPHPILHEYVQTAKSLPFYGAEPPERDGYGWDTFFLVIGRAVQRLADSGAKSP
jgi:hypothetical protein